VRVLLEVHRSDGVERSNGEVTSSDFPLTQTDWTDWYLQPDGELATTPPPANGGHTVYLHGTKRQAYAYQAGVDTLGELTSASGPDEAFFRTAPFAEPMVIAGPLTSTLFVRALPAALPLPLPTDLELMVQVLDEGPQGELTYLQRGVLRASHRAIDTTRSQFTNEDRIYRPYRPHSGPIPDLLLANRIYELLIEIFPVGHVFRPGHRLAIKVHAPSLDDNDWIYVPKSTPALVTLFHDAEHPSSIMLPVVPAGEVDRLGPDLGKCASSRVRCVTPGGELPSANDLFGGL
jgi:predicted acyl esterase